MLLNLHSAPGCRSGLAALMAPLAAFSTSQAGLVSGPVQLRRQQVFVLLLACGQANILLIRLLEYVDTGKLELQEGDALRLLAAASLPLQLHPKLLHWAAPQWRDMFAEAENMAQLRQMDGCCLTAHTFLCLAMREESRLPPRVAAAARATSLRPQALLQWVFGISEAASAMGETCLCRQCVRPVQPG